MLRRSGLLTALAAVTLASSASATTTYTGSISTPLVSPDGGSVTTQISVTATCDPAAYCGFFPEVTTVPATQPCIDEITGSTWVGTLQSSLYGSTNPLVATETASWSEWPMLFSGSKHACLYANTGSDLPVLVAQADYVVPAPPASPVYVPPVVTAPVPVTVPTTVPRPTPTIDVPIPQSLSRTEAVGVMRSWLKRKYGHRWTRGRQRVIKCPVRTSPAQLGCYGVWLYGHRVLSRIEVVTETEDSYIFSKDFLSAPAQNDSAAATPATPTTSDDFCATHVCIPNYDNGTGSTVQCSDGSYSHSGGKQGACSHHGGVSHSMRQVAASVTRIRLASRLTEAVAATSSHLGSNRG